MSRADLSGIAARVVELARSAAPGAEVAVSVDADRAALTRFANSIIHQNVSDDTTTIRLTVHADGRTAVASTTGTGPEALAALVERTAAAVRLSPVDPGWAGLTPPTPLHGHGRVDEALIDVSPTARAAVVRAFIDAAAGLTAAGYCRTTYAERAFANSAGHLVTDAYTEAAVDAIARTATSDGLGRFASNRLADLDGALLGARAAAKARAAADPVELPRGHYEVVLESAAVADLLLHLAGGFDGRAVSEGRSFFKPGERQFDRAISFVDDPFDPDGIGYAFDADGTPKRRFELVRNGLSLAPVHDRRTAAAAGAVSTGHGIGDVETMPLNLALLPAPNGAPPAGAASVGAVAGGPRADGASAAGSAVVGSAAAGSGTAGFGGTGSGGAGSSVNGPGAAGLGAAGLGAAGLGVDGLGGGGPVADGAVGALVAGVERGILVTDHHYTRVLDERTLVVTGLTRNGVWLIEGGEITRAVRNFRFTQSYPGALAAGSVLGVGTHAPAVPNNYLPACMRAPALRLASWNFTGNASG